jgi:predicted nuclease of predicted toxin-antitoxin system
VKLLFDQNISHRVVSKLKDYFPDAKHVRDFNLQFSSDKEIWNFAKENDFAIVTFDSDFNDFATLFGLPPKIIWLRIGNTLMKNLVEAISSRKDIIFSFLYDESLQEISCLEIDT